MPSMPGSGTWVPLVVDVVVDPPVVVEPPVVVDPPVEEVVVVVEPPVDDEVLLEVLEPVLELPV